MRVAFEIVDHFAGRDVCDFHELIGAGTGDVFAIL